MPMYRQGDVLLMPIKVTKKELEAAPVDPRGLVLAEGETSGHHHALFGSGAKLMRFKFTVVDADVDPLGQPRRLLRRDDVMVVELTNSTVDADGTRRVYHIEVEPELRPLLDGGDLGEPQELTALNAVASTYGMRGNEYVLSVET